MGLCPVCGCFAAGAVSRSAPPISKLASLKPRIEKNNQRGLSEILYLQIIRENHGNQGYKPLPEEIHDEYMEQGPGYRAGFALYIT